MWQFIIIVVLIWLLYYFSTKNKKIKKVVKCSNCGAIVSKDEAILQKNTYYCSKDCL